MTKQYKLLAAKERLHSVAGKVTVGLESHWPCVTDLVIYPPTGLWQREWYEHSPYAPVIGEGHALPYLCHGISYLNVCSICYKLHEGL